MGNGQFMVSMSAVWDRTTEFLSDNLAAVTPIALLAFFVPASLKLNIQPLTAEADPLLRGGLGLAGVALSILILWGTLVLTAMAVDPAQPSREVRSLATRRLLPAIGIWLIALVAALILCLPLLLLAAVYQVDLNAIFSGVWPPLPSEKALALIACAVILVPPALWLWARFASVLFAVVVVERRGAGAFGRTFALTRGVGWRIIGVFLLYFVMSQVLALAIMTGFGSVLRLLAPSENAVSMASVVTAIAVGMVQTIFGVLLAVFTAKLYVALRGVHDGASSPA